jgi:hypothetical protein
MRRTSSSSCAGFASIVSGETHLIALEAGADVEQALEKDSAYQ